MAVTKKKGKCVSRALGHSPSRWNDARQNWTATQRRLTEAVVCVQATGSELRPWKQSLASVSQVESAPQQGARAAGRETWGHQTLVTPGGSLCGFCRRPQRLSIWSLNCVRHFVTPMHNSTPGFPVHHQLPDLAQTHVHQVGDAIQQSHPLLSPSPPPPAFSLSQHQGLFQWVTSAHQEAKVLEFQLQHQSFQ